MVRSIALRPIYVGKGHRKSISQPMDRTAAIDGLPAIVYRAGVSPICTAASLVISTGLSGERFDGEQRHRDGPPHHFLGHHCRAYRNRCSGRDSDFSGRSRCLELKEMLAVCCRPKPCLVRKHRDCDEKCPLRSEVLRRCERRDRATRSRLECWFQRGEDHE